MSDEIRSLFMHNLWRRACGMPEVDHFVTHRHGYGEARGNWFPEAVALMRNRMAMGIYRHGDFRDPEQADYDRVASAIHRLHLYQQTGNGEHLIDVANLACIEFSKRAHPRFHFAAIDDGYHTEVRDGA